MLYRQCSVQIKCFIEQICVVSWSSPVYYNTRNSLESKVKKTLKSWTEHGHFLVQSHLIVHSKLGDSCFSYVSFRRGEDNGLYFYTFSYIPFHVFIFRKEEPSIALIGYQALLMNSVIYHVLSFSTKESCQFNALHSVLGIYYSLQQDWWVRNLAALRSTL